MRLGIKAHWRDAHVMAAIAREVGAGTLEVHLAPADLRRDLERTRRAFAPLARDFRIVVHQPEWVTGAQHRDRFVNPGAADRGERDHALAALADAARFAHELGAAGLVVHPGALALDGVAAPGSAADLRDTLARLRDAVPGVPLWLENMPWFYGHADGRNGRSTLARAPVEVADVADVVDGYCLDFCHAFLSAPPPGGGWAAVSAFLDAWGARIRHAHVSGALRLPESEAKPNRGEGIAFTEGEMEAEAYARALARLPAEAAVVPEIMDGFKSDGRGFREALTWLRRLEDRAQPTPGA